MKLDRRGFLALLRYAAVAGFSLVASDSGASAGDVALGQYLASECTTCHQLSGRETGGIPSIVAWPEDQFVAVLNSYKSKSRDHAVMQTIASRLTEEDVSALAAYFARVPSQQKN